MRRLLIVAFLLSGCTSLNEESVAGGGCDRKTTYGIEFQLLGVQLDFGLAAQCEEIKEE